MAKPGKPNRVTVDLSPECSVRAGWLVDVLKDVMALDSVFVGEASVSFVKSPDVDTLSAHFSEMFGNTHAVYFSDDSCVSIKCSDGMLWLNLDISACDASNGPAVFNSLYQLCPEHYHHHLTQLINQCKLPISIGRGSKKLLFKPKEVFEYSGSVLTTLLNNVASLAIVLRVLGSVHGKLLAKAEARALVELSLEECGWKCTAEWCDVFEKLQFLKHSPCFTRSFNIRAVLNLGVILRASGRIDGDLPGRGDWRARAYVFMCEWVSGLSHAGNSMLLRSFRKAFPPSRNVLFLNYIVSMMTGGSDEELMESSLCRRYGISLHEMEDLCDYVANSRCGMSIACAASKAILELDYGLSVAL